MTQTPSGQIIANALWGPMTGFPPAAVVQDYDKQLVHVLPDVQSYFSADAVVKSVASPLAFYDRCLLGSQFSGEVTGTSPTDGVSIGSLPAITAVNASNKSLRATKTTTLLAGGGYSVLAVCNVSSAMLALSTVYRALVTKAVASLARFQLMIIPTTNQWVIGCPITTPTTQNVVTAPAPAVGVHVLCASISADLSVRLYDNRSGTPAGSGTLANPHAALTDRWAIGGPPGGASPLLCWDGLIGPVFFMERNPLHGTAANDAARAAAMAILGAAAGISIDPT